MGYSLFGNNQWILTSSTFSTDGNSAIAEAPKNDDGADGDSIPWLEYE